MSKDIKPSEKAITKHFDTQKNINKEKITTDIKLKL